MFKKLNLAILITPILLFSFGLITLMSTSTDLVYNHLIFFIVGLVFYFIFAFIDHSLLFNMFKAIYVIALLLLLVTYLYAGFRSGSARWLEVGSLSFQTSEFAKLAFVITISSLIAQNMGNINKPLKLLSLIFVLLPMSLLIYLQPDLGTVVILIGVFSGLLFFGGIKTIYIFVTFLTMGIFSAPFWNLLQDYQKNRILVFLNPQLDVLGSGYNVIQSMIAVGSGGLMGKGFGRGTQANLQFLPAHWTDFIFASFAEEWGFVGVFFLVTIFTILLFSIIYVAFKSSTEFGRLLALGIFLVFFMQFIVNVGMNMGVMPVTGVTLPLVSYGGSSILFSMISLGIVQNIWLKR